MSSGESHDVVDPGLRAASTLLDALRREQYEEVRQSLAWPLRLLLSARSLGILWSQASRFTGPMEKFQYLQYERRGYLPVVKALVSFQKCSLAFTVTLGPRNSVIGFHIQPPGSLGSATAWQSPIYVDESEFSEIRLRINPFWVFPGAEAVLAVPKSSGQRPAILVLQGSGISDLDISIGAQKPAKDLAWGLASKGLVVLRVGKPVLWVAYKSKVTGDVTAADEYQFTGIAALRFLAKHPKVDPAQIFVAGFSMGGRFAPRLCQQSPIPLAGMVSIAGPAQTLCETFISQAEYMQKHFPEPEDSYRDEVSKLQELSSALKMGPLMDKSLDPVTSLPIALPSSYFIDDEKHSPAQLVKQLSTRFLILQGMRDWQVAAEQNLAGWRNHLDSQIEKGQVRIMQYNDLPHTMVPFEGDARGMKQYDEPGHIAVEVIDDIAAWIQQDI